MNDEDTEWFSVTRLGSVYEHEVSRCGRYERHRLLQLRERGRKFGDSLSVDLPWVAGPPPERKE